MCVEIFKRCINSSVYSTRSAKIVLLVTVSNDSTILNGPFIAKPFYIIRNFFCFDFKNSSKLNGFFFFFFFTFKFKCDLFKNLQKRFLCNWKKKKRK